MNRQRTSQPISGEATSSSAYDSSKGRSSVFDTNGETKGWALLSAKYTYVEPLWPELDGNHEFVLYVVDRNKLGTGIDGLWVEVRGRWKG